MANPVVHFEVWGKDGDAIQAFYGKTFGWKMNVMKEMGGYGMTQIAAGKGIEGGVFGYNPEQPGPESGVTFYIEVDDINAYLKKVEKAGGKTTVPRMEIPGVVTMAQFSDPDGNLVGLVEAWTPAAAAAAPTEANEEAAAPKKGKAVKAKKAEKSAKAEKPAKAEKAAKAEKPAKAEKAAKAEKPAKAEKAAKAPKAEKAAPKAEAKPDPKAESKAAKAAAKGGKESKPAKAAKAAAKGAKVAKPEAIAKSAVKPAKAQKAEKVVKAAKSSVKRSEKKAGRA